MADEEGPWLQIEDHRRKIDEIDEILVKALCEKDEHSRVRAANKRDEHCISIGNIKKRYDLPTLDNGRENQIIEKVRKLALKYGGDPDIIEKTYIELMKISKEKQEALKLEPLRK